MSNKFKNYHGWKYQIPVNHTHFYAKFDIKEYESSIYCYIRSDVLVDSVLPKELFDYIYLVTPEEEDFLLCCLPNMHIKERVGYKNTLDDFGFNEYNIYQIILTPTMIDILKELKHKYPNFNINIPRNKNKFVNNFIRLFKKEK